MSKQSNIKNKIQEQYGKIALTDDGSISCCSSSGGCCGTSETLVVTSPRESSKTVGYDQNDLKSIPQSSILGLGCGWTRYFVFSFYIWSVNESCSLISSSSIVWSICRSMAIPDSNFCWYKLDCFYL